MGGTCSCACDPSKGPKDDADFVTTGKDNN